MTVSALGRVNVTSPGTAVPLSSDPSKRAAKILIQVIPGLSGKAYVGVAGMNRATLAGVIRVLWPNPGGGISDEFFLESSDGSNSLYLSNYYLDMDVAGEGVLISYWTA
jgi:hypothetical protein